jgi:hypothetical protein
MIFNINQNTPSAMTTTITHINTNITGSITFARRLMLLSNSSSCIFKIFSREFSKFAVSSQTFIRAETLLGIR